MFGGATKVAPARIFALASFALIIASMALLPARAGAASGWEIVLDRPTPNFGAVDFVSDSEGWMTAGAGLLHTTDAGATWTEAAKLTGLELDFADPQHGWLVGLSGTIYATTDDGATWNAQTSGTSVHLSDVEAISATEAWAVGAGSGFSDIIMPEQSTVLLHTMDAGATWQHVDTVAHSWYSQVEFAGQNGWALGSRCDPPTDPGSYGCTNGRSALLRTTGGGGTWAFVDGVPQDLSGGLTFIDANNGWATGRHCVDRDDCARGIYASSIYRTRDGGATWDGVDTSAYGTIESFAFENAETGWALGSDCRSNPCLVNILTTEDGGATWYQPVQIQTAEYAYGRSLVLQAGTLYWTGSGEALRSLDGGRTWLPIQHPAIEFQTMDFVNARTGYAIDGVDVVRTDDSGASWRRVSGEPFDRPLLEFLDPSLGFAAGYRCTNGECRATVVRTSDGGQHWATVHSGYAVSEGLQRLEFTDRQHGWVVTNSQFMFTDDGGDTWREHAKPADAQYIVAADLADHVHAWAVTQTCTPMRCDYELVRSTDAGRSWENVRPLTSSGDLLQFADRDHGWYVDQICTDTLTCRQVLFATSDGGTTWDVLDIPSYPQDMEFTDAQNGWMSTLACDELGCAGKVFHTGDGGRTWTAQLAGPLLVGDLAFAGPRNGWLALYSYRGQGIGGGPPNRTILYHTSDGGGSVGLPDVGAGQESPGSSALLPLLLSAAGAMALVASFALRRRRS